MFKEVPALPNFIENEKKFLEKWYFTGIVDKYLHKNDFSKKRFSFLDGPITANNPMGVQHGQGRTLKDLFQRYKNMQGFKQRFQNGFDCQGLWLEVQEEKDLGLNSKKDIESYGVEKFCDGCRARVEKFSRIQTEQSKRLGMFMDWDNSYYTMSEKNNLYIWYFLKKCYEKGWIYKGVDSLPWCPRCGTAISQHELSDDGYKMIEHTSVYVKFPLKNSSGNLLIWTTTPWTLAVNVAVAVNPKKDYAKIKLNETGEIFILAKNRLSVIKEEFSILETKKGISFLGMEYTGPFDELPSANKVTHKVIEWKEVSDEEGSGFVHIAPGAGEEDFQLSKKFSLPVLAPLNELGIYTEGYGFLTGKSALSVKEEIFESLKEKKILYKTEKITHSYPHCWRCKQELVFRTTSEWFIKSEEIRPVAKKAARKANWMPKSAGKRMEDWLDNMGDWPISRRRYWGLALPFYECSCGELIVVGSKEELKELAVDKNKVKNLKELHRPWIDEIKIKCPKCKKEVSRVKEVGDCWLDAGIIPFSTIKYLEDKSYWKEWFPFEFITEYIGQVKLWFYATLFMAVTLENKAPWKNVLATGYIVDGKGEPMHKTKGNDIPFDEAADKMGVDIMRWVYMSGNLFDNTKFSFALGEEVRRRFLLILWNSYKFFVTYANLDKFSPSKLTRDYTCVLDRWVLSKLNSLVIEVTNCLDNYDASGASKAINDFVINTLSTWYIRRIRNRVGLSADDEKDKNTVHSVLYTMFLTLAKLTAPFMPFISEEMYLNLSKNKESVHLEDWPTADTSLVDISLEKDMDKVREVVEKIHSWRKLNNVRVRMPIKKVEYLLDIKLEDELENIIKEETNVKNLIWKKAKELAIKIVDLGDKDHKILAEGYARDMVREAQGLRKKEGCVFSDIVSISYPVNENTKLALKHFKDYISKSALIGKFVESDKYEIL
ncbi:MAG: isoleucine--tRNA ligase [Patescibacteria group bacterium]|nr:isoleucine--tRNA ligase [Patescibacteria group bacterium]